MRQTFWRNNRSEYFASVSPSYGKADSDSRFNASCCAKTTTTLPIFNTICKMYLICVTVEAHFIMQWNFAKTVTTLPTFNSACRGYHSCLRVEFHDIMQSSDEETTTTLPIFDRTCKEYNRCLAANGDEISGLLVHRNYQLTEAGWRQIIRPGRFASRKFTYGKAYSKSEHDAKCCAKARTTLSVFNTAR